MDLGRRPYLAVFITALTLTAMDAAFVPDAHAVNLVWSRTFNGAANGVDQANGVAVAPDGSVYVAGFTDVAGQDTNIVLRKYSASGAPAWMRTYNGTANSGDYAYGVAAAADNSVYVIGSIVDAGPSYKLFLRKYSAAGNTLWTRTLVGADGAAVAVAADTSVYVTGSVSTSGGGDLLLRKYSATGTLLWSKSYDGPAKKSDGGLGVAVASDGNVFVAGATNTLTQASNLLLQKWTSTGTLLWTKTYNDAAANGYDRGRGVAVAPDGSIYVAGDTVVTGHGSNLLLRKYSATGTFLWMRTCNGTANSEDTGYGVAATSDGVYVAGTIAVTGQSANLLLRKYTAGGAPLWTQTYDGTAKGVDVGFGVDTAADGSVYVTGTTEVAGQSLNLLLRKYK